MTQKHTNDMPLKVLHARDITARFHSVTGKDYTLLSQNRKHDRNIQK